MWHTLTSIHADEGAEHMEELSKLAEKDPEFYKYLQENDPELLHFTADAAGGGMDEDEDMDEDAPRAPVLTKDVLRRWQKAMLDVRTCGLEFRSDTHSMHNSIAKVAPSAAQAPHRVPVRRSHERGRPGPRLVHR